MTALHKPPQGHVIPPPVRKHLYCLGRTARVMDFPEPTLLV
jgi:hypothetical protein